MITISNKLSFDNNESLSFNNIKVGGVLSFDDKQLEFKKDGRIFYNGTQIYYSCKENCVSCHACNSCTTCDGKCNNCTACNGHCQNCAGTCTSCWGCRNCNEHCNKCTWCNGCDSWAGCGNCARCDSSCNDCTDSYEIIDCGGCRGSCTAQNVNTHGSCEQNDAGTKRKIHCNCYATCVSCDGCRQCTSCNGGCRQCVGRCYSGD